MIRSISVLLCSLSVAGCATAPPEPRSARAEAHLQQLLGGKSAGVPVSCLPRSAADRMSVIDDGTVVFRRGGTVYRNDFEGGSCTRLGTGFYALVTQTTGSGLCRGDIARVIDTASGAFAGSCVLGDFVPYTSPRG